MIKKTTMKTKRKFDSDGKVIQETSSTVWEEDTNQYGSYFCQPPEHPKPPEDEAPEILIKYHDKSLEKIKQISIGDWIDLRAAEEVTLWGGEMAVVSLGVSMQLPKGYEAIIAPRSSTCKRLGITQPNSIGVIDNSYCGDGDVWGMPVLATRDTVIHKGDRICQFRILKSMGPVKLTEVDTLENTNRGGFGSTNSENGGETIVVELPKDSVLGDLCQPYDGSAATITTCGAADDKDAETDKT